jgi:hypothetical protein
MVFMLDLVGDRTEKIIAASIGLGGVYELNDKFNLLVQFGNLGYNLINRYDNILDKSRSINDVFATFRPSDAKFGIEFKF